MSEEIKEIKKWQPINIIFGLIIAIAVVYYSSSDMLVLTLRLLAALVLIFTKRSNFLSFLVLFILSATVIFSHTPDVILIIAAASYMLVSSILRIFRVKNYALIGMIVIVVFGLAIFTEYETTFVSEKNLNIKREINNGYSIVLRGYGGNYSDVYNSGQVINPEASGLSSGTYAYRIVEENGEIFIPLDKWPVFNVFGGKMFQRGFVVNFLNIQGVALHGTFNSGKWIILEQGNYTIQLVKISRKQATIVSERKFSIIPYSEGDLSGLETYMTVDDGPQKYYDTYTHSGNSSVSVTVWVKAPSGRRITGRMKSFLVSPSGEISSLYQSETQFETNEDGNPKAVSNMSGHILPGIFHIQVIIDGNIIRDLK